jgi:hypothetical protein
MSGVYALQGSEFINVDILPEYFENDDMKNGTKI